MPDPTPRRVLAVGDIHGCCRALSTLLDLVGLGDGDLLVTLGDMVDRGPDSRGVLELLIGHYEAGRLVPLRGNHELMMLRARSDWRAERGWRAVGGEEALASYAPPAQPAKFGDVPDRHWKFMAAECADWYQSETHLFAHAGLHPHRPLRDQEEYELYWMTVDGARPHYSGKVLVCGHTEQRSGQPLDLGHTVCIDTAAYAGGWLTCLDVGSGEYWQAKETGETRAGSLR
jgi:serine/threonine protein phosphatase 1